jgi:hypothetical protein
VKATSSLASYPPAVRQLRGLRRNRIHAVLAGHGHDRREAAAGRPGPFLRPPAASREVIEDDLSLTDALQVPIDQLGVEARERARPERPGQLGYPGPRARSTPCISARHGAVNAIPADCRMPW